MEREISSGAMLGIVLLALAAVIGLGFGVFAITKGVANEGTVNVQDSLGTVSTQIFLDYDQKVITGQQIISALRTFEGKPYAVLVATKAVQSGAKITPGHKAYVIDIPIGGVDTAFINYNAILARTSGDVDWTTALTVVGATRAKSAGSSTGDVLVTGTTTKTVAGNKLAVLKNGSMLVETGFSAVDGNIIYDRENAGIHKTGNAEYVATTSKFQAYVIKDGSGNIMGIAAVQQ